MIKAAAYGSFAPAPDTLSVALAQVQKYGEEAAFAAEQAVESAAAAEENAQAAQDAVERGRISGKMAIGFYMTRNPRRIWTAAFLPMERKGKALILVRTDIGINGIR